MRTGIKIEFDEVLKASRHLKKVCPLTPIFPLDVIVRDGVEITVYGKFENVGTLNTFKARGAEWLVYNLITNPYRRRLPKQTLVTASAGNHAQGVAAAGQRHGLESIIYMPASSPEIKVQKVEGLGAKVNLIDAPFEHCVELAKQFAVENNQTHFYVPPYENRRVIEGQATVAHDILGKSCLWHDKYWGTGSLISPTTPDVILCGLGGGGLVSGTGAVCKHYESTSGHKIQVIGVQTESADAMHRSFKRGKVLESSSHAPTVAEGIGVRKTTRVMLDTVRNYVDDVVLVKEKDIERAIGDLARHKRFTTSSWIESKRYRMPGKINLGEGELEYSGALNRVEGAGAATYAVAVYGDKLNQINLRGLAKGRKKLNVYCIFSGGNISDDKFLDLSRSGVGGA